MMEFATFAKEITAGAGELGPAIVCFRKKRRRSRGLDDFKLAGFEAADPIAVVLPSSPVAGPIRNAESST
ncbi:MAG: hypothetical protein ACI8W8_002894 [Rhodothermales bacterium]|jgi:hypothetical protein